MGQVLIRVVALAVLAACGDNQGGASRDDAGIADGPEADANVDELRPCLDRPAGDLARPPTKHLPCDLLPPRFAP